MADFGQDVTDGCIGIDTSYNLVAALGGCVEILDSIGLTALTERCAGEVGTAKMENS